MFLLTPVTGEEDRHLALTATEEDLPQLLLDLGVGRFRLQDSVLFDEETSLPVYKLSKL